MLVVATGESRCGSARRGSRCGPAPRPEWRAPRGSWPAPRPGGGFPCPCAASSARACVASLLRGKALAQQSTPRAAARHRPTWTLAGSAMISSRRTSSLSGQWRGDAAAVHSHSAPAASRRRASTAPRARRRPALRAASSRPAGWRRGRRCRPPHRPRRAPAGWCGRRDRCGCRPSGNAPPDARESGRGRGRARTGPGRR